MNKRSVIALMLGMSLAGGVQASKPDDQTMAQMSAGVVQLSVAMNELALACEEMSAAEVAAARGKQREAVISDMKMSAADYDALYEKLSTEFKQQWRSGSDSQRKEACDQLKSMPR